VSRRNGFTPIGIAIALLTLTAAGWWLMGHQARAASPTVMAAGGNPYLARLTNVTTVGTTVAPNGDVNPYGLVFVPSSTGKLVRGDLLVSNYNDKANNQGTGTTLDELTTAGKRSLFASINPRTLPGSCPGGVGLTTALDILPGGYVVVGSLPTTNGKSATARYGCLIVLNSAGKPVSTIAGSKIQGPWDSTEVVRGSTTTLFVSMVLNGGAKAGLHVIKNSTVVRITLTSSTTQAPKLIGETVIANAIPWRDDPAALAIGPTGVALSKNGTLYVADTLDDRIAAIANAMTRTTPAGDAGSTISRGGHLKQPLGLVLAPNGDIISTNAGDGDIVETTPAGQQVAAVNTKFGAGSLFGVAIPASHNKIYLVDDGSNTLAVLH
jgi:hypothetical protein